MNTLTNPYLPQQGLLPNYFQQAPGQAPLQMQTLSLNQVEGFEPVREFRDQSNTLWSLVKAASNSTVGIPDPKSLQIVDYWNHSFPRKDLQNKLYIYVVEAIKQPQVETEKPTKVLFQWFSPIFVPQFSPQMISQREWLKANVYSAEVVDARVSKLNALCKVSGDAQAPAESEERLLQVEGLSDGHPAGN